MGSKHLRQLLDEDQEPFVLQNYIHERRCQLRRPVLQIRRRKSSPRFFCKNACFSPELNKSPLFYAKSPCRNAESTIFIHVPSRTAALLLEAALRIQRPKSHKSLGLGFFGSILSKLGHRRRNRKREIMEDRLRVSVKDILTWDSTDLEDKFTDLKTSTSRFGNCSDEKETDSSPIRLPELESPARSPGRRRNQVVKNKEGQQNVVAKGYEEEEKEHSSPVSVLDPQFEEDDDDDDDDNEEGQEDDDDEQEDNDELQLERSFAIVQRTKQKLLLKLRRFEQLAALDPIELEKRVVEEEKEEEEEEGGDDDSWSSVEEEDKSTLFAREVISCSNLHNFQRVPPDIKKLILDLADEEEPAVGFEDKEFLAKRLCMRLGSWRDAEMKTIDMMVEFDLRREGKGHWGNKGEEEEHVQDISAFIELGIFRFLVDELSQELVHDSSYYL